MSRPTLKATLLAPSFAVLSAVLLLVGTSNAEPFGVGSWPVNGGVLAPGVVVGPPVCPAGCDASITHSPAMPVAEPVGCDAPSSKVLPCGPLNPTVSYPTETPPPPPQPTVTPTPAPKPVARQTVKKQPTAQKRTRAKLVRSTKHHATRSTTRRTTQTSTRHGVRRTRHVVHQRTVRRPRPVQRTITHATPHKPVTKKALPTAAPTPPQPVMTTPPMGLQPGVNHVEVSPCQPITVPVTCP